MPRKLILSYKRKRQGKTDYRKRLALLKSGKLRIVIRKSLKNILVQIIKYEPDGDKILVSAHSNQLKKFGWKLHKGNKKSAYLTGFLAGIKAKKQNINEAILDIGLAPSIKNSVFYAAVKGALDSGLNIPASEEILPKIELKEIEDVKNKMLK